MAETIFEKYLLYLMHIFTFYFGPCPIHEHGGGYDL